MLFANRIFLNWDETAEFLKMDREGLRQALLHRWSPIGGEDALAEWLPVMIALERSEFMTTLQFQDSSGRKPDFFWNGRDTYYRNCDGKAELTFSDGSSLPLRGQIGKSYWTASHGHGSGWGFCFEVGGGEWVISPETIANACEDKGYIGGCAIAPFEWCEGGFPDEMCFVVVDCTNTVYKPQPRNLFDCALFRRSDLEKLATLTSHGETVTASQEISKPIQPPKIARIRSDREQNLLRVIAGLWALSELPKEHYTAADKLAGMFSTWNWEKPDTDAIARALKEAANLPGAHVGTSD